jgi:hypothetical protein
VSAQSEALLIQAVHEHLDTLSELAQGDCYWPVALEALTAWKPKEER